ncbi:MAG: hypothetical protein ACT4OX_10610 [Actinomycetota bacterium]
MDGQPNQIRVRGGAYAAEEMPCLRCGLPVPMRFAGPCPACTAELRANMRGDARALDASYVPKMNVTPNAVAVKDN